MKRIGILTSGGDSPGMNATIMAVAKNASVLGAHLVGIQRGYNGLLSLNRQELMEMPLDLILDIADRPGTFLRTARCEEFKQAKYQEEAANYLRSQGIEDLIVIGGDGSFQGAMRLCELGIRCITIPATIDNDLAYTETSLGFDTAVNVCVDAIRSIRSTSRSHDRPAVVEVMGRHSGEIALAAAMSTGAEMVLVPEEPWSIPQAANRLNKLIEDGNTRATCIVAEGCWEAMEDFDFCSFLNSRGKICFPEEPISAVRFASVLKRMCNGAEVRATVLGYTQRGASPTSRDSTM
ncbi:MAG: ATP-dependent 6-phosphofructokinase, partial [Clostridiales bacterium]|nr:ATP-dependent 6-phosphofructokinase [Clostridiales bacterium]